MRKYDALELDELIAFESELPPTSLALVTSGTEAGSAATENFTAPAGVGMQTPEFEHFAVANTHVCVSICRACLRFIAAAPVPSRLAVAERLHDCSWGLKKPPASVSPGLRQAS